MGIKAASAERQRIAGIEGNRPHPVKNVRRAGEIRE